MRSLWDSFQQWLDNCIVPVRTYIWITIGWLTALMISRLI